MSRIEDKISEIFEYLEELENILPENFEEYSRNKEKKAACERYFEKIVETLNDLAMIFIKEKRFELPTEDIKAFEILMDKKIISDLLCEKLKDAKGMRNFLAHKYGEVNDEIVFEALTLQIIKDAKELIKSIEGLE